MSRLAKKSIKIADKTEVIITDSKVTVKGPLGELSLYVSPNILVEKDEEGVKLTPKTDDLETMSLWGTYASHIMNMIEGVTKGFTKKLIVDGIGYKADVKGNEVVMSLGFSHQVKALIPEGVKVTMEKNNIIITGSDKNAVGQFAAYVRSQKKPEPYKGKGIRYEDEVIRRKQGKKSV